MYDYCCCYWILQYLSIITAQLDVLIECSSGSEIKPWNANTDYEVGDVVRKGNKYYECILAHTSTGQNKPPNTTYWEDYVPTFAVEEAA